MSTFVCYAEMNTFVCKTAPKLYHIILARVKHCYKLLQLGVVFFFFATWHDSCASGQTRIILICIRNCVHAHISICLYKPLLIYRLTYISIGLYSIRIVLRQWKTLSSAKPWASCASGQSSAKT